MDNFDVTKIATLTGSGVPTQYMQPDFSPIGEACRLLLEQVLGRNANQSITAEQAMKIEQNAITRIENQLSNAYQYADSAVNYVTRTCIRRLEKIASDFEETAEHSDKLKELLTQLRSQINDAHSRLSMKWVNSSDFFYRREMLTHQMVMLQHAFFVANISHPVAAHLGGRRVFPAALCVSKALSMVKDKAFTEIPALRTPSSRVHQLADRTSELITSTLGYALSPHLCTSDVPIDATFQHERESSSHASFARQRLISSVLDQLNRDLCKSTIIDSAHRLNSSPCDTRLPQEELILCWAAAAKMGVAAFDKITQSLVHGLWQQASHVSIEAASACSTTGGLDLSVSSSPYVRMVFTSPLRLSPLMPAPIPALRRLTAVAAGLVEWLARHRFSLRIASALARDLHADCSRYTLESVWSVFEAQLELAVITLCRMPYPCLPQAQYTGWLAGLDACRISPPCDYQTVRSTLEKCRDAGYAPPSEAPSSKFMLYSPTRASSRAAKSIPLVPGSLSQQTMSDAAPSTPADVFSFHSHEETTHTPSTQTGSTSTYCVHLERLFSPPSTDEHSEHATCLLASASLLLSALEQPILSQCPGQESLKQFSLTLLQADALQAIQQALESTRFCREISIPTISAALAPLIGVQASDIPQFLDLALVSMLMLSDGAALMQHVPVQYRSLMQPVVDTLIQHSLDVMKAKTDVANGTIAAELLDYMESEYSHVLGGSPLSQSLATALLPLVKAAQKQRPQVDTLLGILVGDSALLTQGVAADISSLASNSSHGDAELDAALSLASQVRDNNKQLLADERSAVLRRAGEDLENIAQVTQSMSGRIVSNFPALMTPLMSGQIAAIRNSCNWVGELVSNLLLVMQAPGQTVEKALCDFTRIGEYCRLLLVSNMRVTVVATQLALFHDIGDTAGAMQRSLGATQGVGETFGLLNHSSPDVELRKISRSVTTKGVYLGAATTADRFAAQPRFPVYLSQTMTEIARNTQQPLTEQFQFAVAGPCGVIAAEMFLVMPEHVNNRLALTSVSSARVMAQCDSLAAELALFIRPPQGQEAKLEQLRQLLVRSPLRAAQRYIALLHLQLTEIVMESRSRIFPCSRQALKALVRRMMQNESMDDSSRIPEQCAASFGERMLAIINA